MLGLDLIPVVRRRMRRRRGPVALISVLAVALPAVVASPAAHSEPPGNMNASIVERPGDSVLNDGLGEYRDAERTVMATLTVDSGSYGDTFALQVWNPRYIHVTVPGTLLDQDCGYGAVRVGRAQPDGAIYWMTPGTTKSADAYVECYASAARRYGWNIDYNACASVDRWLTSWTFRVESSCTALLNRVEKGKTTSTTTVTAPFRVDAYGAG